MIGCRGRHRVGLMHRGANNAMLCKCLVRTMKVEKGGLIAQPTGAGCYWMIGTRTRSVDGQKTDL
jgi:hypothetical protein